MNYAWPVDLGYRVSADDAIAAMGKHAPACVLIKLGGRAPTSAFGLGTEPDYVIALTGGGMDLSDHIAAAYLACGCVPPARILRDLGGVITREKALKLPLRQAYRDAVRYFAGLAKEFRGESRKVHARR